MLFVLLFLVIPSNEAAKSQSEKTSQKLNQKSFVVTFECESCTVRNKFSISGPEEFNFKKVQFPLRQRLEPGEYEMTYWQNRVQQIHLPFSVGPNSKNVIIVK
jgi:hypothetical protein